MWYRLGQKIVKYKVASLFILTAATLVMGYFASQIKLSYEFTKAIPEDNEKFVIYKKFVQQFGVDGTTMVVGFQTDSLYTPKKFNELVQLQKNIKAIPGVTEVLGIPSSYNLSKDTLEEKFNATKVFDASYTNDSSLQAHKAIFEQLPFYQSLLYNPKSHAYIMAISFIPDSINSGARSQIIKTLTTQIDNFGKSTQLEMHLSGLPYIRTILADRIKKEMIWFLFGSLLLCAITLFLFFRSFSAMLMSLAVVAMG